MAKKPDVTDPGLMDVPALNRMLTNRIEAIEMGVKAAIDTVKEIGSDIQTALQVDLQEIKPICEQFPNLCKKVEDLKSGMDNLRPTESETVSRAADNLALHYKQCTDPACRRAIEARMAAVGLGKPPDPQAPAAPGQEEHAHDHAVEDHEPDKPDEPAGGEVPPWDKLRITESKYKKHKAYYDDALKMGA